VLIKMDLTDETWHLVKNTPKVTGFLGSKGALADYRTEAQRILRQVQEGIERPKPSITFEIGEQVRVSDGPFTSFNGVVEEVDEEKARLKVAVSIFGRSTPSISNTRRWRRFERIHRLQASRRQGAGGSPRPKDRATSKQTKAD
jgi:transcription antitermination factor NusG